MTGPLGSRWTSPLTFAIFPQGLDQDKTESEGSCGGTVDKERLDKAAKTVLSLRLSESEESGGV